MEPTAAWTRFCETNFIQTVLVLSIQDFTNLGVKKVCVMTDKNVAGLPPLSQALASLHKHGLHHDVFSDVRVEPTDKRPVLATLFYNAS